MAPTSGGPLPNRSARRFLSSNRVNFASCLPLYNLEGFAGSTILDLGSNSGKPSGTVRTYSS